MFQLHRARTAGCSESGHPGRGVVLVIRAAQRESHTEIRVETLSSAMSAEPNLARTREST